MSELLVDDADDDGPEPPLLGPDGRRCVRCGCTSIRACPVPVPADDRPEPDTMPCSWVEGLAYDLCSACVDVEDEESDLDEFWEGFTL